MIRYKYSTRQSGIYSTLPILLFLGGCTLKVDNIGNERPNIIHIMADDHAFQAISAYGSELSKLAPTPNIDRLAKEGMLFTSSFVVNSLGAPSRATLLTGKYSHLHGQMADGPDFDDSQVTFVELLQKQGYQTAIIGKWYLKARPKGFDYFKVLPDQGEYYNPSFMGLDDSISIHEGYTTKLITDFSIEWIRKRKKCKPFCLLLHHKAPHRNWMPESKYLNHFEDTNFPLPSNFHDTYENRNPGLKTNEMSISEHLSLSYDLKIDQLRHEETTDWIRREWADALGRMTELQLKNWKEAYEPRNEVFLSSNLKGNELAEWKYQRYIKDYLRCILSLDEQVGRLLDFIEKEGLTENTIVVYTSDQGLFLGEHGWFDKRYMYEESFRIPLIIRYPSLIEPGSVCKELIQNIDFAPTYLDLASVDIPEEINGVSLVPLFKNPNEKNWRKEIYYQYFEYPAIHSVRRHYGVRNERYKLIHFYGEGKGKDKGIDLDYWELYDLNHDPCEMKNLYNHLEYMGIQEQLHSVLDSIQEKINDKPLNRLSERICR